MNMKMKRIMWIALAALTVLSFVGCAIPEDIDVGIGAFEAAVNRAVERDGSYKMLLEFALNSNGELENNAKFEAAVNRSGDNERIALTTYYYGVLPTEEASTYADGVFYSEPFNGEKVRSEMTAEEYVRIRKNKLYLRFLNAAGYESIETEQNGSHLTYHFGGERDDVAIYLRECLSLPSDFDLDGLKLTAEAEQTGDTLTAFSLDASGSYVLYGEEKTFTVHYELSDFDDGKAEAVSAPAGEFVQVQGLAQAYLFNGAYKKLATVLNFSVNKTTAFTLEYGETKMEYSEESVYFQTTKEDGFHFSNDVTAYLTQNGETKANVYELRYQDGTMTRIADGAVLDEESGKNDLDVYQEAPEYYNSTALIYEGLSNVTVTKQNGLVTYTYEITKADTDAQVASYLEYLYELKDYLETAKSTTYGTCRGTLTVEEESGILVGHQFEADASYDMGEAVLHCTVTGTVTPEKAGS